MTLNPLGSVGPAGIAGAGSAPQLGGQTFGQVMKAQHPGPAPLENAPIPVVQPTSQAPRGVTTARPGPCRLEGPSATAGPPATRVLDQVSRAQQRMEEVLALARSGRHFSPAELLSLQAHVYRATQELDLAGKVVEKATGGVKQVLQTQV